MKILILLLLCNIIYILIILYLISSMDNCNKFKLPKNNENNKKDSIFIM